MKMLHLLSLFLLLFTSNAMAHIYGPYKIGMPYKIQNEEYKPTETKDLVQTGVASWYGKELEGKLTANGAIFNPNLYTAAHKTLPMPSAVLITNTTNNKRIIAVINDRGPFASEKTRIIDVSKKVAETLGFADAGRANVKIEYMHELSQKLKNNEDVNIEEYNKTWYLPPDAQTIKESKITTVSSSIDVNQSIAVASTIGKTAFTKDYIKAFYVQVGVFEVLANAQKIYKDLSIIPKIQLRSESYDIKNYYIVRSGPFESKQQADAVKTQIQSQCKTCQTMVVMI